MILDKIGYSYQDLTIVPETITDINSRSECNTFDRLDNFNEMLPIFASPMSTITNEKNIDIWKNNHIMPIIPRNIDFSSRKYYLRNNEWVALSLTEFKSLFVDNAAKELMTPVKINGKWLDNNIYNFKVCVDLANGHMKSLYEAINKAKEIARKYSYNIEIMTGNVANPETYKWICENAEVDYIRLSIGTGNNCITSTQTSIHYPIATLIDECYQIKTRMSYDVNTKSLPKIIADGGIRGYADVIKAIGLGADYVMIGSLFTGLLESAAPLNIECYNSHYKYSFDNGIVNNGIENILNIWETWTIDEELIRRNFIHDMKEITKESYGMSTKKAQKLIDPNAKTKTSEGCTKYIKVKETVKQWSENMVDYFKSAMSYTNKRHLYEFRGNVNLIPNSSCAILAVNK